MAQDPLAVSTGIGRGEAVVHRGSSYDPVQATERAALQAYQITEQKKRERKAQDEANAALLSDDIKSNWDTDNFNYFQPKLQSLKKSIVDRFKETGGRLTPLERKQFENEWSNLKNQANLSNTVYKGYVEQAKALDKDAEGKFDREKSANNLRIFRDPSSNPETARELNEVYGGDVLKWRANNAGKYGLVPSWNEDKYYGDMTKDETTTTSFRKNKKGEYVTETLNGQTYGWTDDTIPQERVDILVDRMWRGTSDNDKRARERAAQRASEMFVIANDGSVGIMQDISESQKQTARDIINSIDMRGMSPQEKARALSMGVSRNQFEGAKRKSNPVEITKTQSQQNAGGTGSFTDKYVVTTVYTPEDPQKVQVPGDRYVGGTPSVRTVSIKPKQQGADTETFSTTLENSPIRPVNYKVNDETGEVVINYTISKPTGQVTESGFPIVGNVSQSKKLTEEQLTEMAVQYGFGDEQGGVEAFKRKVLKMQPKKKSPTTISKPVKTFKGVPKGGF